MAISLQVMNGCPETLRLLQGQQVHSANQQLKIFTRNVHALLVGPKSFGQCRQLKIFTRNVQALLVGPNSFGQCRWSNEFDPTGLLAVG